MPGSAAPIPHDPHAPLGRRAAARLRLSVPARLVSVLGTHDCYLVSLSQTGARVVTERPLATGASAWLQIAAQEHFCIVVRAGVAMTAMVFEEPLNQQQVLDVRTYAERFDANERAAMRAELRAWVQGRTSAS